MGEQRCGQGVHLLLFSSLESKGVKTARRENITAMSAQNKVILVVDDDVGILEAVQAIYSLPIRVLKRMHEPVGLTICGKTL